MLYTFYTVLQARLLINGINDNIIITILANVCTQYAFTSLGKAPSDNFRTVSASSKNGQNRML